MLRKEKEALEKELRLIRNRLLVGTKTQTRDQVRMKQIQRLLAGLPAEEEA